MYFYSHSKSLSIAIGQALQIAPPIPGALLRDAVARTQMGWVVRCEEQHEGAAQDEINFEFKRTYISHIGISFQQNTP